MENLIYVYDGSLRGLYCCVFDSVYLRQMPMAIQRTDESQPMMLPSRQVETDAEKAGRVRASIPKKISRRALDLVETVFCSFLEEKELNLLRFLLRAYKEGPRITNSLGDPLVSKLLRAEGHLLHENHLLTGFVRFSDQDGLLVSTITPKNFVLPFLTPHFVERFPNENFLIYDKTHKVASLYQEGEAKMISIDALELNEPSEREKEYRALWRQFYHTIAIESRINPRCQMTHMPKRYWENMTEMQDA